MLFFSIKKFFQHNFYNSYKFKDENSKKILLALETEFNIRKFKIECEKIDCYGQCGSKLVNNNLGKKRCTLLESKMCLEKQIKLLEDL